MVSRKPEGNGKKIKCAIGMTGFPFKIMAREAYCPKMMGLFSRDRRLLVPNSKSHKAK